MAPKVFITGATGYIGGDALYVIARQHPDLEITALVRTEEKAKAVTSTYPKIRTVLGDLDDAELLEKEAAEADIVIHTADASDHVIAAKAISKGLISGHTPEHPGYWLHTGGTGILTYFDSEAKTFGEPSDKIFNDDTGVDELVNLPSDAFHRNVDEIVLETGKNNSSAVKTAIICPPTIYGVGRGPSLTRGRQVYELASFILNEKYCPKIGKGLSIWNNVHIHDLSSVYSLLISAAINSSSSSSSSKEELWGEKAYYLTENGSHIWGDLSVTIGQEAIRQSLLPQNLASNDNSPPVKELSYDDAVNSPAGFQAASWGMNSRATAIRAKKLLGWTPKERSMEEEVPVIVRQEGERLGKA